MTNFNQKCFITKDYNTKNPKIEKRINPENQKERLMGSLTWLDGKDFDGKNLYTKFNFSTSNQEIMNLITENTDELFEISGFLKNKSWKDKNTSEWRNYQEIVVIQARLHENDINQHSKAKVNGFQSEEDLGEIPF